MNIKHSNKPKTPLSQTDNLIRTAMSSKSMLIILLQLLPNLEKLFSRTLVLQSSIRCIYAFGIQVYNPKEELMAFHGSSLPSILLGDRNFSPIQVHVALVLGAQPSAGCRGHTEQKARSRYGISPGWSHFGSYTCGQTANH